MLGRNIIAEYFEGNTDDINPEDAKIAVQKLQDSIFQGKNSTFNKTLTYVK